MNLVGAEHEPLRSTSVELASGSPDRVITLVRRAGAMEGDLPFDVPTLDMPQRHALELRDVDPRRLESVLLTTYERAPQDFETLLGMEGVRRANAARPGAGVGSDLRNAREHARSLDALKRLGRFARATEPTHDDS